MIWSARKQYYLGFWAFLELKSVYILIKTRQIEGFILASCILGNFQYGGDHMWNVCILSLKEYEIITLMYNRKNMQVIFIICLRVRRCKSLSHPSLHYEVRVRPCLNMNWSTPSADSGQIVHLFIFLIIYNYKLLKAFPPKHL